jgi:phage terminase large subunit GpA-like protein
MNNDELIILGGRERRRFFRDVEISDFKLYESEIYKIIDSADVVISNLKPSEWCEQNRMMTTDVSPIPGMFSYKNSPYTREIVDCLSPGHPSRIIAIMKGAQIGFSTSVIEAGIGWIISQNPGNILFLVGSEDLVKDASNKIDRMINNSGLRDYIRPNAPRLRNTKSGDTDTRKEYPGGYLKLGLADHKSLRNISMQYGFIDDFEGMKSDSKQSGSTRSLVEARFTSYDKKMKLYYISTPEVKSTSNIEPVYLLGDQRKYHIPCPCCGEYIPLEWEVPSDWNPREMAGITWKLDDNNKLIADSVGYTCQKCGGFFDDTNKTELISLGQWIPTAEPSEPGYYSYHISGLYSPVYMSGWIRHVRKYLENNPIGGERDEVAHATFVNLVLGQTYEPTGTSISATKLQENIRPYKIGTIPEKLSLADGNGRIVLITCGSDINGTEDDARLDYEIVAHAESGATYSIDHGSIGTFINKDKNSHLREKFTAKIGADKSIWPIFEQVLSQKLTRDTDGKQMKIFMTGVDTGHLNNYAIQFVEKSLMNLISLKGDGGETSIRENADIRTFKKSAEKSKLYLVNTNRTKDILSKSISLKWDPVYNSIQPFEFMNFPEPSDGKYGYKNYYQHYEAEHKIIDKNGRFIWKKKQSHLQNHLFDCRLYAMVVRDIFLSKVFEEMKIKNGVWQDYVDIIIKKRS